MEGRRQEYRSAIIRFATALLAYRVAEANNWHARHGEAKDEVTTEQEVRRLRAAMWDAFYELKLSSDNRELNKLAQGAADRANSIWDADTQAEMNRRVHRVREDLDAVIAAAWIDEPFSPRGDSDEALPDDSWRDLSPSLRESEARIPSLNCQNPTSLFCTENRRP